MDGGDGIRGVLVGGQAPNEVPLLHLDATRDPLDGHPEEHHELEAALRQLVEQELDVVDREKEELRALLEAAHVMSLELFFMS